MQDLFSNSPLTFVALVFFLSLLIGSFLNVVIYRLPIMMERAWRGQCQELAETPATETPAGRFDLVFPRSSCTSCGEFEDTSLQTTYCKRRREAPFLLG